MITARRLRRAVFFSEIRCAIGAIDPGSRTQFASRRVIDRLSISLVVGFPERRVPSGALAQSAPAISTSNRCLAILPLSRSSTPRYRPTFHRAPWRDGRSDPFNDFWPKPGGPGQRPRKYSPDHTNFTGQLSRRAPRCGRRGSGPAETLSAGGATFKCHLSKGTRWWGIC